VETLQLLSCMDISERLSIQIALEEVLKDPITSDLLLSACAAAAQSDRKASGTS
jgi:hypothetical protein